MTPTRQGSFQLFRFAGIDVYLHWSWFIFAAFEVSDRSRYSSVVWNLLEYGALFGIVLMHEFGHSLACRQVGGKADQIVLWPLGGVAYVDPPQRPGANLWSIAAGPLVNVILLPILGGLWILSMYFGWSETLPNLHSLFQYVCLINVVLLVFNLLPIYPLDGGQIFRCLLWFAVGRGRSLMISTVIGMIVCGGIIIAILVTGVRHIWWLILAGFAVMNCWAGFQYARSLTRLDKTRRHTHFACPSCKAPPPAGEIWVCGRCQGRFDTFLSHATCPNCGENYDSTRCVECGAMSPMSEWTPKTPPPLVKS